MDENDNISIGVVIAEDFSQVELTIPGDFDRDMLSVEFLQGSLLQHDVEVNTEVIDALTHLLEQAMGTEEDVSAIVANSQESISGRIYRPDRQAGSFRRVCQRHLCG